jgi:hypothetical protein
LSTGALADGPSTDVLTTQSFVPTRPLLTIRHKTIRLWWARDHMEWNIRSWQRVHWSDESGFCWLQLMAASAYGDREAQHFYRNILCAQLHLVELVLLFGDAFL